MFYPELKRLKQKISRQGVFGGLYKGKNAPPGQFSDMENLSGNMFPLMSVRRPRALWTGRTYDERTGIFDCDGRLYYVGDGVTASVSTAGSFCVCSERYVYINGKAVPSAPLNGESIHRSIVSMGKNIIVFPEAFLIKENESKVYEAEELIKSYATTSAAIQFCDKDGNTFVPLYGTEKPVTPVDGNDYVELSDNGMLHMVYSQEESRFIGTKAYMKITADGIEAKFSAGDYLFFDSAFIRGGTARVTATGEDALILDGVLEFALDSFRLSAKKMPPAMDMVIEHNNRLWGARYGISNTGEFVNEIYASAQGKPGEWYSFEGTAMDSFSVSLGCSGDFTGVTELGNDILFFKEDYVIKVSGDTPWEFTVKTYPLRGVEKGSRSSIVSLDGKIYYKGREGIMCYDGVYTELISEALGEERFSDASAGSINGKYYVALTSEEGKRSIFVYDTGTALWHKENDPGNTRYIITHKGSLFYVTKTGYDATEGLSEFRYFLWDSFYSSDAPDILGDFPDSLSYSYVKEEDVGWYCETGITETQTLPDRQMVRNLLITLSLGENAYCRVSVIPDSSGEKKTLCFIDRADSQVFSVPVATPPCYSFRLVFEGKGDAVLHSLVRKSEITGEVINYGTG